MVGGGGNKARGVKQDIATNTLEFTMYSVQCKPPKNNQKLID